MENVQLQISLLEQVTGPAKQAQDALQRLRVKAVAAGEALDFSKELKRSVDELARLKLDPKGFQAVLKAQKEIEREQEKLKKSMEPTFLGMGSGGWAAIGVGVAAFGAGLVAAGVKFASIIKDTFDHTLQVAGEYEKLKLGFDLSLGKEGAEKSRADIARFADKNGFDDDEIAKVMLPLLRAGFDQQGARTAFTAAADVAAGRGEGGNLGLIQSITDAFEHIRLRGEVQERMLPSLGVDARAFYQSLGAQLKVSAETAKKMAGEGKVDPQRILNTIYQGIERAQGGNLGTGSQAYGKTFSAYQHRLEQLPDNYLKKMEESPAWDKLKEKMDGLLDRLSPDSENGKKIMAALFRAFDKIVDLVEKIFTPENIDRFADTLEKIVGFAGDLVEKLGPMMNFANRAMDAVGLGDELKKKGGGDVNKGVTKLLEENNLNNGQLDGMDKVWNKVRGAEDIGWWKNLNLEPGEKVDYVNKALTEGKISQDEANTFSGQASATGKKIVTISPTIHVTVAPGENAEERGQAAGRAAADVITPHIERAAQEAGVTR